MNNKGDFIVTDFSKSYFNYLIYIAVETAGKWYILENYLIDISMTKNYAPNFPPYFTD
jgi:hypothetical protein